MLLAAVRSIRLPSARCRTAAVATQSRSATIAACSSAATATASAAAMLRRPPRLARLFSSSATDAENAAAVGRWSARLAHDNTFLSYHRNAIIATVAGCALIQYRKGEGRPPLAGTGLLIMGGLYIYVGSGLYVWQCLKLRTALRLGRAQIFWSVFNAFWPLAIWSVSLACLLDETPNWLIELLRHSEQFLPSTIHSSLFLDPPALYPVCRLLHAVVRHEECRLQTVLAHAADESRKLASQQKGRKQPLQRMASSRSNGWARPVQRRASLGGGWGESRDEVTLLSDADVSMIIQRRLERMRVLADKLNLLTRSQQSVPTALAVPLLDTLQTEATLLEKVLEVDTSPGETPSLLWSVTAYFSSEHTRLVHELDAVRALRRRLAAVKFTSVAPTARALSRDGRILQSTPSEVEAAASSS